MADKIYLHLVSSTATDIVYTQPDGTPAPILRAGDASPKADNPSSNPASVVLLDPHQNKKKSIQIGMMGPVGTRETNAVIKLYAVRDNSSNGSNNPKFSSKPPSATAKRVQRLIAKIQVVKSKIVLTGDQKVRIRESLSPRPKIGGNPVTQNDHGPHSTKHSKRCRISKTGRSATMFNPGSLTTPPPRNDGSAGFLLVHGDTRISFSPNVV